MAIIYGVDEATYAIGFAIEVMMRLMTKLGTTLLISGLCVVLLCTPAGQASNHACAVRSYVSPVYSYSHYYQASYPAKVIHQYEEVIVPKAVRVEVSKDFYASTADYYRDNLIVDATIGRLQKLNMNSAPPKSSSPCEQELASVRDRLAALERSLGVPSPAPKVVEPKTEPKVDTKPTEGATKGGVPDGLAKIVETNCLRCHGAGARDKGGNLDLRDLASISASGRWEMFDSVASGAMPKGARIEDGKVVGGLTDAEIEAFVQYARAARRSSAIKKE